MLSAPLYITDFGKGYPFIPISLISDLTFPEVIERLPKKVLSKYQINQKVVKKKFCPVPWLKPRQLLIIFDDTQKVQLTFPVPFSALNVSFLKQLPEINQISTRGEKIKGNTSQLDNQFFL